jgi:hypothetical protein
MPITVSGTTVTFNDATTQTTAPVNTNANVTSVSAGSGISVSATTGAITISATGGGTVTSVATGNGLSGGTITSSGTLTVACPSFNSVGSYCHVVTRTDSGTWNLTSGLDIAAGSGSRQIQSCIISTDSGTRATNNLSGTWRWLGATFASVTSPEGSMVAIGCRVS